MKHSDQKYRQEAVDHLGRDVHKKAYQAEG